MTYIRSTFTYCKYSKKRYDYKYGTMGITNYYRVLRRPRYLFIKSNALHIYYVNIFKKDFFSFFQKNFNYNFFLKNTFLKINNFYIRF